MDGESWSSMPQVQWSFHPSGVSAQQVPEPTQTAPENPGRLHPGHTLLSSVATWHPVRTDPAKAPPPQDQETTHPKARPSKIQCSLRGARQSRRKRLYLQQRAIGSTPCTQANPKSGINYVLTSSHNLDKRSALACHGKQKATLRLTKAVSICEVYVKNSKQGPTKLK